VELQLTPAGREAVERLIPLMVDKLNFALADFSSAEVQELHRLLIKFNTSLQSPAEPRAPTEPRAAAAVGADS
jgi:DNA-binding MarR family transcriptional regulator